MRRIPIVPVVLLLIAVAGWVFTCDRSGCETVWNDITAFGQSIAKGKMDTTVGKQVLTDTGTLFETSFTRSAKDLHVHVGMIGKTNEDTTVVIITGDEGQGSGFLTHMPDGPAVITNLHVVAGNPHLHVRTSDGRENPILSLAGASDRDLAKLSINDDHYHYLELAKNFTDTVQAGDDILTPGNSEGGGVTLDTPGKVVGIGPDRIEISNPIFHGNSGGPVIDEGSGQVLGVVTYALKRAPTDFTDEASRENPNSAITSDVRYFALRVDTVTQWDPYDADQFARQAAFLKNFEVNTRCIDSILNGLRYEKAGLTSKGAPDSKYYLRSRELVSKVGNHFVIVLDGGALVEDMRVATLDLIQFGQEDMGAIQNPANFYPYEWKLAQEETAYRKHLLTELDLINKKIN
jgi:hypothetical protein